MITTIIFDLSEVYLHGLVGIEEHIEKKYNFNIDHSLWKTKEQEQYFHGKITENEYLNSLIKSNHWPIKIDELKKVIRLFFEEIEGTRKIIEELKENGYKLGLLSVHGREWIEYNEKKFDYHKLFDATSYSFEVAVCKPERKAFELILQKLQVQPQECIFIDDMEMNVVTAENTGMKTIQFVSPEQLRDELKKLHIEISS